MHVLDVQAGGYLRDFVLDALQVELHDIQTGLGCPSGLVLAEWWGVSRRVCASTARRRDQ